MLNVSGESVIAALLSRLDSRHDLSMPLRIHGIASGNQDRCDKEHEHKRTREDRQLNVRIRGDRVRRRLAREPDNVEPNTRKETAQPITGLGRERARGEKQTLLALTRIQLMFVDTVRQHRIEQDDIGDEKHLSDTIEAEHQYELGIGAQ